MKPEFKFIILVTILFLLDWFFDGIDFKSFIIGALITVLTLNFDEVFKWKK